MKRISYDSEHDLDNPYRFHVLAHGAGYAGKPGITEELMHVDSGWRPQEEKQREEAAGSAQHRSRTRIQGYLRG